MDVNKANPNHVHGYPDNEQEWLDAILGLPIEPEQLGTVGEWYILDNDSYVKSEGLQV